MMDDQIIKTFSGCVLPPAFLSRMEAVLGEEYAAFADSFARVLRPSLRINLLKCDAGHAGTVVPFLGEPVAWQAAGFYYGDAATAADGGTPTVRPGKHPLHEAGVYYIQEASAMLPASLCPPAKGERVLDLCAAPGGKASQLAAALDGEGLLVANEIHKGRAAVLSQNMERMGVRNAVVTSASPDELVPHFRHFFHKIVVDAPCSGEGMFRREADAVTMWSPENVAMCAARQAGILDAAAEMLAEGGYLTYSTCTFAPEENEGTVMDFLLRHPDFEVVPSTASDVVSAGAAGLLDGGHPEWLTGYDRYPAEIREAVRATYRVLPHHAEGEGHFAALLRKKGSGAPFEAYDTASQKRRTRSEKDTYGKGKSDAEATAYALFSDFCREVFGHLPTWVEGRVPCLFGERLYLAPVELGKTADEIRTRLRGISVLRTGISAGTVTGQARNIRFEPDHALALAAPTADTGTRGYMPLSEEETLAYLHGETVPAPNEKGYHIMTYLGFPLGWGKASGGMMKNHYPKGLRRQ